MEDFLGTAPPPQLLILLAFPLTGAALLTAFIIYTVRRRANKPKMKHGIDLSPQEAQPIMTEQSNPLEHFGSLLDSDAPTLKGDEPPPQPVAPQPPQASPIPELGLNLDILAGEKDDDKTVASIPAAATSSSLPLDSSVRRAPQPSAEPQELLRLLRDSQTGELILEIGSQRYQKLTDIADKKIGEFILKLIAHLLAFTNGMIMTEAGVKAVYNPKVGDVPEPVMRETAPPAAASPSPPSPAAPSEPSTPKPNPLVPPPPPEAEAAFLASLRTLPSTKPEPPVAPPPRKGLFGRGAAAPAPTPLPGLNLAGEINQIVQTRLKYSPLGESNRIDITSGPDGGIQIIVNLQAYDSPDEIADPDIKTLIKESIKEWEQS